MQFAIAITIPALEENKKRWIKDAYKCKSSKRCMVKLNLPNGRGLTPLKTRGADTHFHHHSISGDKVRN